MNYGIQQKKTTLAAAEVTMQKSHNKRKNWIFNDTFEWIRRKNKAKTKSTKEYKKLQYKVQKWLWKDKQEELETLCNEIEENVKHSNGRPIFQTVK